MAGSCWGPVSWVNTSQRNYMYMRLEEVLEGIIIQV